ncbi:MAG: cbb3-type cytochrome c oxidase subunit II [Vicingus serpentipes]|nr:cbb3-type cytochrome c oxidase subunit II [Vicingus serpentipes]
MINLHKDHKSLLTIIVFVFLGLSTLIAIIPAYNMQTKVTPLSKSTALTQSERNGLKTYISEGCVSCHTQQVRNIAMDNKWGDRPSIPSDYYYSKQRLSFFQQSPSVLGSERTGPDLTSVGTRQPSDDWHLLHLYNPRIVVKESVMPGYSWLFEKKKKSAVSENDIVLNVSKEFVNDKYAIIAKQEALDLVSYLKSLKQADLYAVPSPEFIPASTKKETVIISKGTGNLPNGEQLYMDKCASCHQLNGEGLGGAFPSLKGSPIVLDKNHDLMIQIILAGYDARSEYAVMPAFSDQLSDAEVAAITNHEKTSWGNNAQTISEEDVKKVREYLKTLNP